MKKVQIFVLSAAMFCVIYSCASIGETSKQQNAGKKTPGLYGMAIDSMGRIYIQATDGTLAQVDSRRKNEITYYQSTGMGGRSFGRPFGIAVDSKDRIYIIDQKNIRLVRIDNIKGDGWKIFDFQNTEYSSYGLRGLHIDSKDRIYVGDEVKNRIIRMDNIEGDNIIAFGNEGSGPHKFKAPIGITTDQNGVIYISDAGNGRIVRIDDMNGTGWETFGSIGSGINQFNSPHFTLVSSKGAIWVSDPHSNRLISFEDFSGRNWEEYTFGNQAKPVVPMGLVEMSNGMMYLVDSNNSQLIIFQKKNPEKYKTINI